MSGGTRGSSAECLGGHCTRGDRQHSGNVTGDFAAAVLA